MRVRKTFDLHRRTVVGARVASLAPAQARGLARDPAPPLSRETHYVGLPREPCRKGVNINMENIHPTKYFLVEADILPEIFVKVVEAKRLLETGEAATVAQATARLGISRSAFYKYKDSIAPFQDLTRGRMITLHITLRHKMGVLSSVLSLFANTGANILTINQSIPISGTAFVTISAETADMSITADELIDSIQNIAGVKKAEIAAG